MPSIFGNDKRAPSNDKVDAGAIADLRLAIADCPYRQ